MNVIKKIMLPAMLGFVASSLMVSLAHATTLSDLQSQCLPCHDVTVSPSNWVLSLNAIGTPAGRIAAQKTLSGWATTISSMSGKCGFSTIGPGGTSQAVAAQFLYDKQVSCPAPPTAPPMCSVGSFGLSPNGCPNYFVECPTFTPTFTPTPTGTTSPTPTFTVTPTATSCPPPPSVPPMCTLTTWGVSPNGCPNYAVMCPPPVTPTATFTPTPTPTTVVSPTPTTGTHTWYDYDYLGGRCFQKDHTIMDKLWCEQHGLKGGGSHPSLTGYQRHAHLDSPGQKP